MNMARSSYYYYQKKHQTDKYRDLKDLIEVIYHRHEGRFGYRRITLEIRNKGILINPKTVQRLMKLLGLKSLIRAKNTSHTKDNKVKLLPIY